MLAIQYNENRVVSGGSFSTWLSACPGTWVGKVGGSVTAV